MTGFKRWLIVCGVWFMLSGSAQASVERHCTSQGEIPGIGPACQHRFTAKAEPQSLRLLGRGKWETVVTRWLGPSGDFLTTFGDCVYYGRQGPLRVRENVCDGRLTVTVRTVGPPTPVAIQWTTYGG